MSLSSSSHSRPNSQTVILLIATGAALLADMAINAGFFTYGISAIVIAAVASRVWEREWQQIFKLVGLSGRRHVRAAGAIALLFAAYAILFSSCPADAQFFQGAQTWMSGVFPKGGTVIPLVFNVLRGLFIIYLGISLVQVVQAARNDEDWQTLARTPLIILITLTLGDTLSSFITGSGGS